jgi:hypothetical protein
MGLDMYLNAKRYLYTYRTDTSDKQIAENVGTILGVPKESGEVKSVVVEAGYWRKANAIHQWFVNNVQEGDDDCGNYYVDRDTLVSLRNTCQEVIADPDSAKDKLPTTSGFFFGDTSYSEYYFDDLKRTVEIIDNCLKFSEDWDFEYHSSW